MDRSSPSPSPSPPLDALLAHAAFARALARDLLRDEHRADDLVQEAWIAAIENPPREGVRAWLRAVLRNLASNARREGHRREARERLVARSEARLPEDVCVRAETLRTVVDAVLGLDEPYRSTVLLRYFDDVEPQEIARRQGIPGSTVRTRLQRALAQLRERLDDRTGGERRAWVPLLLPFARDPRPLPRTAGAGALRWGSVAAAAGALTMKKTIAVAVALLLVLGGAALVLSWRDAPSGRDASPAVLASPAEAAAGPRRANERSTAPTVDATSAPSDDANPAAAPKPAERTWRLRGRLAGFDASAHGEATLSLGVVSTDWRVEAGEPVRVRTAGEFDVDVTELARTKDASELTLEVDHPQYLPASTRVPIGTASPDVAATERVLTCEVRLLPAAVVRGQVVDAAGRPLARASVASFACTGAEPDATALDLAASDADGRFALRTRPRARHLVVAAQTGRLGASAEAAGVEETLAALVLRDGASVAGRVTRNGRPFAGAAVEVNALGDATESFDVGDLTVVRFANLLVCRPTESETGDDGSFRIGGLPVGPCLVTCGGVTSGDVRGETIHGSVAQWLERKVEAPAVDVVLAMETARLVVEVQGGGRPVAGAHVWVTGTSPEDEPLDYSLGTDAAGHGAITVRSGAVYEVSVRAEGFARTTRTVTAGEPGAETCERFELEPPQVPKTLLRIALRDGGADPPIEAGVRLYADGPDEVFAADSAAVRDGRIELPGVPPGRHRVIVRPGGSWYGNASTWLDVETDVTIPAEGAADATVTLRTGGRLRIAARDDEGRCLPVRCTLRDAAGTKLAVHFGLRSPGGWCGGTGSLASGAPSTVEPALAPGTYRVDLGAEDFVSRTDEIRVESGRWTDLDVTMTRR